ncbi:MAG: hypothetical protein RID42_00315 [Alphaproteobacteria bacterium]
MTPMQMEARRRIDAIYADQTHPYWQGDPGATDEVSGYFRTLKPEPAPEYSGDAGDLLRAEGMPVPEDARIPFSRRNDALGLKSAGVKIDRDGTIGYEQGNLPMPKTPDRRLPEETPISSNAAVDSARAIGEMAELERTALEQEEKQAREEEWRKFVYANAEVSPDVTPDWFADSVDKAEQSVRQLEDMFERFETDSRVNQKTRAKIRQVRLSLKSGRYAAGGLRSGVRSFRAAIAVARMKATDPTRFQDIGHRQARIQMYLKHASPEWRSIVEWLPEDLALAMLSVSDGAEGFGSRKYARSIPFPKENGVA